MKDYITPIFGVVKTWSIFFFMVSQEKPITPKNITASTTNSY
jgi:hypothetical protein